MTLISLIVHGQCGEDDNFGRENVSKQWPIRYTVNE